MTAPRHAFPRPRHNHAPCMRDALAAADALARQRGLRFTPLRRHVLEIILGSHRPMGAYDILHAMGQARGAQKTAPPTVYRALDFLLREGFVHRIDTMNAFVACFEPERGHRAHFLLCRQCGCVAEIEDPALAVAVERAAADAGFTAERETVEIVGLCAGCAERARASSIAGPSA